MSTIGSGFETGALTGYRWKILVMVYVCGFSMALVFQSIPPVLRLIVTEFGITHAQAGLLMSLFALPGVFISIPGGLVSDRNGVKRVTAASLLLMIVGSFIVGVSGSFALTLLGRIVSGIGAMIISIILPKLVSSWFRHGELGLAMGIFNTVMPLGMIVSFNILSSMGLSLGWRTPVLITSSVTIFALIVFLLLFREENYGDRERDPPIGVSRIGVSVWLVGLSWMWFNAAFISFLTFSQDFFVTRGFSVSLASLLTSLVMLISLPLSPVVGYVAGRFTREEILIAVGGAVLAILLFLIPLEIDPFLLLVLMGVFSSFIPPSVFSLPSKLVDPRSFGTSFGIISTCLNVGILAGPFFVGFSSDVTGGYVLGFHMMSLFAVLQVMAIMVLFSLRRRIAANV